MMGGGMGGRSKYGSPNPKVEEELKRPRRGILLRLGKYLWQMKWFLLLALGLTIGGNTFSLLGPTLSGKAIDCIGTQAGGVDFAGVRHYALLMVLFYLVSAIMSYFLSVTMVYVSRRVTLRMRSEPSFSILDTIRPISSRCAHSITLGPFPLIWPMTLFSGSIVTSSQ